MVAMTVVFPDGLSEVVVNTVGELDVVLVVEDVVEVDVVEVDVDGVEVVVGVDEVVSVGVELVLVVVSLEEVGDDVVEGFSDEVDVVVSEPLVLLVVVVAGFSTGVDLAAAFDSDIVTTVRPPADGQCSWSSAQHGRCEEIVQRGQTIKQAQRGSMGHTAIIRVTRSPRRSKPIGK